MRCLQQHLSLNITQAGTKVFGFPEPIGICVDNCSTSVLGKLDSANCLKIILMAKRNLQSFLIALRKTQELS